MLLLTGIRFPNLGLSFENVPKSFSIFGITVAFYGIIIAAGLTVGIFITQWQAKRTGQNRETYLDFALYAILLSLVGARLFYVVFHFEEFRENPFQILNIRTGGLAIYGAILTALLIAFLYSRIRKLSFGLLTDTCVGGLLAGQIIGRVGNFFNRESFGSYTDNLFAMQLDIHDVSSDFYCAFRDLVQKYEGNPELFQKISTIRDHQKVVDGLVYIQVHPVFLYEMLWNLVLLVIILCYTKHKKFNGELLLLYLIGYGAGRFWMEGLRLDSLYIWGTNLPVARVLALAGAALAFVILAVRRIYWYKKKK